MCRRITIAVLAAALTSSTVSGAHDKELDAAAKRFEGAWVVVSAEHNGAPDPAHDIDSGSSELTERDGQGELGVRL